MQKWILLLVVIGLVVAGFWLNKTPMPKDFVWLSDFNMPIKLKPRYGSPENVTGKVIKGYHKKGILLTKEAADRLVDVENAARGYGYDLVVYDGYRPQYASNFLNDWFNNPHERGEKKWYYPTVDKIDLIPKEYVADVSANSRGSTVDVTLIQLGHSLHSIQYTTRTLKSGEVIPYMDDGSADLGTSYSFFHEASFHDSPLISDDAAKLRSMLKMLMTSHGFNAYPNEWWHYTLAEEPYPNLYYNFEPDD